MRKHDAPAYAQAGMLAQSTDGRTDGLTQKHLPLANSASTFVMAEKAKIMSGIAA